VTRNSCIVSLYFCTRNPPRYGDRVERTQDKEAYTESRTAREEPCCMLHRQQKQRRGEEIVSRPTQWVAVRCPITGCAVMKKYSMRTSWTSNRSKSVVPVPCIGLNSYRISKKRPEKLSEAFLGVSKINRPTRYKTTSKHGQGL